MNYTVQYDWLFSLLNVNKVNESVSEAEIQVLLDKNTPNCTDKATNSGKRIME